MKTLTEKRFFHWVEDDISVTLRNKSGSYGGGSEVLVIEDIDSVDGSRGGCWREMEYRGNQWDIESKQRRTSSSSSTAKGAR